MKIYLKMIKQWSRSCKEGMIIPFDKAKGRRVIAGGYAVEVPAPKLNRGRPKVETATAEPKGEQAVVTPQIDAKAKDDAYPDAIDMGTGRWFRIAGCYIR